MEEYFKVGLERTKEDREISFDECKKIQRRINDMTKYWLRILNSGINHNHTEKILYLERNFGIVPFLL